MNEPDTWREQWQDPDFAEELLKEKLQRLRADTDEFALPGEDDASSVVANSFENSYGVLVSLFLELSYLSFWSCI